jgi:hypothetical protein
MVAPLPAAQLESLLAKLATSFPPDDVLIATQNEIGADVYLPLHITSAPPSGSTWTLTAADFVNAYQLAQKHEARAILMLGPDSGSLSGAALHDLASAVQSASIDLALPYYDLPPHAGLVNSLSTGHRSRLVAADGGETGCRRAAIYVAQPERIAALARFRGDRRRLCH